MKKIKSINKSILALVVALIMTVSGMPAMQLFTVSAAATVPTGLTFAIVDDEATITWNEVQGASSYKVYYAESRYAKYELLDEDITETSYTDVEYAGDYYKVTAVVNGKETSMSDPISYEIETFGKNTYIFEDTDNMTEVQNVLTATYKTMHPYSAQFVSNRYAFMFAPSKTQYNVEAGVGYYTQVAGLGYSPEDVTIKQMKCEGLLSGLKYDGFPNYSALCNFWRAVENFSSPSAKSLWAVSQATSMRRMNFTGGDLYLHDQGGYASGGFLADSKVAKTVQNGSQQQWLSRNVDTGVKMTNSKEPNYNSAVWNNVLVGSNTSIKSSDWPNGTNTVVDKTPEIAEKPFLVYDEDKDEYGIALPPLMENTKGASWDDLTKDDYGFISINDCYVAKPGQTADEINAGVASKKALVLTPGIYELDKAIKINNADTVVLGIGYATIKPTKGNQCMKVGDVEGVKIAGVLFDAGRVESETLLTVGTKAGASGSNSNPVVLSDCFFRVGGADSTPCKTKSCVIINSNEVICDNFWVWRADHGAGVAWNKNTCANGVIINGNNVTAYGLMVEHFQKVQTLWNGNGGRCYMYQSELPYDITSQSVWNETGSYGFTDYKVASNVTTHEGYGIGIYSCYQSATCFLKSAVTCPDKPGVKFTNVCSYSLSGNGGIDKVINNAGYGVYASGEMARIISYCNGKYTADKTGDKARKTVWAVKTNLPSKVKYTGKAIKPAITVTYKGVKLRPGIDYTVTYKNNTKVGEATVVITGINNFRETTEETFKIVPDKGVIKKVKVSKKKIKVTMKKLKGVKGYQIAYATNKKFKKKKTVKTSKTSYTIKKAKNVKYYVKVRGYRGKTYGAYSKVKICKKK